MAHFTSLEEHMRELEFTIPADYGCLALLDTEKYTSFVNNYRMPDAIKDHFITQSGAGTLVPWGCTYGNWIVKIIIGATVPDGERQFESVLSTGGSLLLTSYDILFLAAEGEDISLPMEHETANVISIEPGDYMAKVVQTFKTEDNESEEVFNQKESHYLVSLVKTGKSIPQLNEVPWFPG